MFQKIEKLADLLPHIENSKQIRVKVDEPTGFSIVLVILASLFCQLSNAQTHQEAYAKAYQDFLTRTQPIVYPDGLNEIQKEAYTRATRIKDVDVCYWATYDPKQYLSEASPRTHEVGKELAILLEPRCKQVNEAINLKNSLPRPKIGMSTKQVLTQTSWGRPNDINYTETANSNLEQWVYNGIVRTKYLYFKNDKLTTIQD